MLVAVGLVVLMMSLFATVFQIATQAMSKQKGFAENDQKARTLAILLKADLDKRTFRRVIAIGDAVTGTSVTADPEDTTKQQGYFYYSENDPYDDTDDVLQFTMNVSINTKNPDTTPLYGRATILMMPQATPPPPQLTPQQWLSFHPNQPEADDGQVTLDNAGSSDTAEVVYFIRNGVLYRRVMLVRKPTDSSYSPDPATALNVDYLDSPQFYTYVSATNTVAPSPYSYLSAGTGGFLADFDFSAYNEGSGVHFHGTTQSLNSLDNSSTTGNAALSSFLNPIYGNPTPAISVPPFLSVPNLRFGFSMRTGRPREYATSSLLSTGSTFLGRFTHEETSSPTFTYPGATPTTTNDPWYIAADLGVDGIATALAGGPRRGEDILLTNVLGFDVKIFDDMSEDRNGNNALDPGEDLNGNNTLDRVLDFRDVGYAATRTSGKQGYYWHGANANPHYGPKVTNSAGNPLDFTAASPNLGTDNQPGVAGVDDDGDGTVDNATERGWPGSDDPWNRIFDTWHSSLTNYLKAPPFRPIDDGPDGKPGAAGVDDDNDSPTLADEAEERGFAGTDDRHPVRAIQIKVRYLDIASGQIRQMTIVQSFMD